MTISIASKRRNTRSDRHSLASSTAARCRLPVVFFQLAFKLLEQRDGIGDRTGKTGHHFSLYKGVVPFCAWCFITISLPKVTWPSPAIAPFPL